MNDPSVPPDTGDDHVQHPRPYFEHPRSEDGWRNSYPSPVLYMVSALLVIMVAALLGVFLVSHMDDPSPYREAHPIAPVVPELTVALLLIAALAVYGTVLLLQRRNGGRVIALVLTAAGLLAWMALLISGSVSIDEEEPLGSFIGMAGGLVFLVLGVMQPFQEEVRDWFSPPLGYYEGERGRLRPQIPFPLAIALLGLWIATALTALAAPIPFLRPELLRQAGIDHANVPQIRQVVSALSGWAAIQAVLCLFLAARSPLARRLTALASLLAVPAGAALAWLILRWNGSTEIAAGTGALVAAGGLSCWVLVTIRPSVEWCAESLLRRIWRARPRRQLNSQRTANAADENRSARTLLGFLAALIGLPLFLAIFAATGHSELAKPIALAAITIAMATWAAVWLVRNWRESLEALQTIGSGLRVLWANRIARWVSIVILAVALLLWVNARAPFLWIDECDPAAMGDDYRSFECD
jgi:hypothetical protein